MRMTVAERITKDLAASMRRAEREAVDRSGAYQRNLGAMMVLKALLDAEALDPSVRGLMREWVREGGLNTLEIAGVRIFPPEPV
jgi:hypothetical protein